jgi:hypothetical protein
MVVFRLREAAGAWVRGNPRTFILTLASDAPVQDLAARLDVQTEGWLYANEGETVTDMCEGRWRLALPAQALDQSKADVHEHRLAWTVWNEFVDDVMHISGHHGLAPATRIACSGGRAR